MHTGLYPSGEIRGQLGPAAAVPEPSSFVLASLAILVIAFRRRFE